jgi:hypothetical protein
MLLDLPEKFQVFGIASRPSSFNVGYPQVIKFAGNFDFVIQGKRQPLALRTIPQRSIID